mmetsp:Transcript_6884/g.22583  ORF Transcript_6884/g.22583 Transcript_6884/m.22583 type:complete len:238 (+) Transcript_6884:195-908(+)
MPLPSAGRLTKQTISGACTGRSSSSLWIRKPRPDPRAKRDASSALTKAEVRKVMPILTLGRSSGAHAASSSRRQPGPVPHASAGSASGEYRFGGRVLPRRYAATPSASTTDQTENGNGTGLPSHTAGRPRGRPAKVRMRLRLRLMAAPEVMSSVSASACSRVQPATLTRHSMSSALVRMHACRDRSPPAPKKSPEKAMCSPRQPSPVSSWYSRKSSVCSAMYSLRQLRCASRGCPSD